MQAQGQITVAEVGFDSLNARESCPIWPGEPIVAHWGIHEPALAEGTDQEQLRHFQTSSSNAGPSYRFILRAAD